MLFRPGSVRFIADHTHSVMQSNKAQSLSPPSLAPLFRSTTLKYLYIPTQSSTSISRHFKFDECGILKKAGLVENYLFGEFLQASS